MSAWQQGWTANQGRRPTFRADDSPQGVFATIIGKLLKWTSADVVVLFGAAVALYVANDKDAPRWLLYLGILASPIFVILGAYAARKANEPWWTTFVKWRTFASIPAFLIWSNGVPDTPWKTIEWVATHENETLIIAGVAAALFTLLAEGVEKYMTP